MNILLSVILSISTLFSSLFGIAAPAAAAEAPAEAVPVLSRKSISSSLHDALAGKAEAADAAERESAVYGEDIRYVHYDPEGFYADTDRLRALADEGDADGAAELYAQLYDEFLYIDALSVMAMLEYDADFYDEYWSQEYTYINNTWDKTRDALFDACSYALNSDIGRSFAARIGRDTADLLRDYVPMTEAELDASDRELELVDKYYALYDTIDDIPYSYEGETWTLDKLFGFRGSVLAETDYDAYMDIYLGLQEEMCYLFAPLYIELIELWRDEAAAAGYDSYAEYAYDYLYWRDYTPEDAQRFCDAIKPIARAYYADLYYSDMSYEADAVAPSFTPEELIGLLGEYLPRIDESLMEPWTALTSRGLYDIDFASSGRYDGSYCTTMLYYHAPLLFATLGGDCYDLTTITHEFGHFSDFWFSPQTNAFTQVDDLDLSEIHSNALQALFTEFYGEIYDEGADVAEFINLANLLENVFDGCVYDEFQRRLLDAEEPLTPELVNRIHTQVCAEYGLYDERAWDSTWAYISHNFEQPLYYISYAASAVAALQIWDLAQTDFPAAVEVYMAVLGHGAHDEGYNQVLRESGLRLFTEEGAVADVCQPVLDRLEALDRAYTG